MKQKTRQEPTAAIESASHTCPSGRCVPGALLIGVVGREGKLGYLRGGVTVDEAFIESLEGGPPPLDRFRFAEPCVEGKCAQWDGTGCGLIDKVMEVASSSVDIPVTLETHLPRCAIRKSCRWFHQHGRDACSVCPLITRGCGSEYTG